MNKLQLQRHPIALAGGAAEPRFIERETGTGTPAQIVKILSIIRRRKIVVAGTLVAALLLGLVVTLLMTPQYTATSIIDIQRETNNLISTQSDQATTAALDQEFYETQYGLLQARSLAERVATNLRLMDNPGFFTSFGSRAARDWVVDGQFTPDGSTREDRLTEAANILLANVDVEPVRHSRLVNLSFTSPDPGLSKRVVDAWASSFIQMTLERRYDASSYARRFLEDRLVQLRARINESERQLVGYAANQGIVNVPTGTSAPGQPSGSGGERPLIADNLVVLNRELSDATAQRVQAQSRLDAGPGEVEEALQNSAISVLRQHRADAAADYARMMVQFEPDYPPARALQSQIEELDRSIAREERRVQDTLQENYHSAVAREEALRERVAALTSDLTDFRRRNIQYDIYQREADTNRQLYDALLQRYKEIGIAGGVGINNISVVDAAETPRKPSSPKLLLNIALALFAGLGLGAGIAFILEQLDQGITDPSDVERDLGVPLLGTTPKIDDSDPVDTLQDRKSPLTEAYLSLQTALSFSTDHGIPRTLVVTSARPAEGKTTTAFALASSIARSKGKVLLVDADMRSPSLHHLFGTDNQHGLSNYLSSGADLASLIRPTDYEGLSLITAGPQPPSAPELLSGERLQRFVAEMAAQFNHIVFDVPPVMGLADAPLLASAVEGTVFVAQANGTHKNVVEVAVGRLQDASAHILGLILTKFDSRRAYYGHGYDYGYGYGEAEPERA